MLNFFLRRTVKFVFVTKIILFAGSLGGLIYLMVNTSPDLGNILLFSLLLFIFLAILLSFFFSTVISLLAALAVGFFLFLRVVGLLSPMNVALFAVFLILLALYLKKR